tara:strand:- start:594 stop:1598 length:1005 start_codon:yes stop_codon:yes gene_type:complete
MDKVLLAEWEEQGAIFIAWPYRCTDWKENLEKIEKTYVEIVEQIADHELVIILSKDNSPKKKFAKKILNNIKIIIANYNDTWTRDYIGLSIETKKGPFVVDFKFNGWGGKYNHTKDNSINFQLQERNIISKINYEYNHFILEGGSIDPNGKGTILTTSKCLLNKNRNPNMSKKEIEKMLSESLGINKILWLNHGLIPGDDTNSHIDTLARYCDEKTIVYSINDSKELKLMEKELKIIALENQYDLIPIELPAPIFYNESELPASYVNFLITNKKILAPIYGDKNDSSAIQTLQKLFPTREIVGIDCTQIIRQNGSLHCATMQVPKNVLNLSLFK